MAREHLNLDFFWLREQLSDEELLSPDEYLIEIVQDLRQVVRDMEAWAEERGVKIPD